MRTTCGTAFLALLTGFGFCLAIEAAPLAAAEPVSLQVQSDATGAMIGVIRNSGALPVRDVRLLVRHTWLWNNERHPGAPSDNPGRSSYYMVDGEVRPGGELRFRYVPSPPLPVRTDGSFTTTAEIVGFVEAPKPVEAGGEGH